MPSPRLEAILELVPARARVVADVGYDHGDLMAALVARQASVRVVGVERQADAGRRFVERHGKRLGAAMSRVELRRGDGLAALAPGEVDAAVVAGLGERTILRMLEAGLPRLARGSRLVACPNGIESEIRPFLPGAGWHVADERLVLEGGRWHEVIAIEEGARPAPDEVSLRFGPCLLAGADSGLARYLDDLERRFERALARDGGSHRGTALGRKLALLGEARARLARTSREGPSDETGHAPEGS